MLTFGHPSIQVSFISVPEWSRRGGCGKYIAIQSCLCPLRVSFLVRAVSGR